MFLVLAKLNLNFEVNIFTTTFCIIIYFKIDLSAIMVDFEHFSTYTAKKYDEMLTFYNCVL